MKAILSEGQQKVWNAAINELLGRISQMDWHSTRISFRQILELGDKLLIQIHAPVRGHTMIVAGYVIEYWQEQNMTWSARIHNSNYVGPIVGGYTTAQGARHGALACKTGDDKYGVLRRNPYNGTEMV